MKHAKELHQTIFSRPNILEKMGLVHEASLQPIILLHKNTTMYAPFL